MANTIDAALIVDQLAERGMATLGPKLAMLSYFTTDFSSDVVAKQATLQIPLATAAGATIEDPTDFEQGATTLDPITVPMTHLSQQFSVTSKELNQRIRLDHLAEKNLQAFSNSIADKVIGLINATNFTAYSGGAVAAADFDIDDLRTIVGEVSDANTFNAAMDTAYWAKFLPADLRGFNPNGQIEGIHGLNSFQRQNKWDGTGAVANLVGFVADPVAIAIGAAVPDMADPVSELVESTSFTLEDLGITVQANVWGSTKSRELRASYDISFGAGVGDGSALVYWVSA